MEARELSQGRRERRRTWGLGSVRIRATLAAVIVVGTALALGALGLLGLLGKSLSEGVEVTGRAQLSDVVALASVGEIPNPLPASRGDSPTQVVGPGGVVLASSPNVVGSSPFSGVRPPVGSVTVTQVAGIPGSDTEPGETKAGSDPDGPYLLLAQTVAPTARTLVTSGERKPGQELDLKGPLTVYVGASLASVGAASTTVALALAGGLPVLTALVGALVWLLCGRALRPVEAIRAEVADISSRDLHRRVPEPATMDEVGRLARTMNAMLERLEDGVARQHRFVADASHELRSPLTTIQATLEVSLAHPEASDWQPTAVDALEESRRLQRLVEDLLILASADEGALVQRAELVDLDELVLTEVRRMRRMTATVGFDLHRVSAGQVRGDRAQLARVVQNLLDNAQRHATGLVGVELASLRGQVTLVVADDGPGLGVKDRERIFERFTRLDEARSIDDGGTGLGLAIVREIINLHEGTVEAVPAAAGARFVVTLPAACDD